MTRRLAGGARALGFALVVILAPACASLGSEPRSQPPSAPRRGAHTAARPATFIPRFFFAGDGRLRLRHGHFKSGLDVRYRRQDGSYDREAIAAIRRFFRSRQDGREDEISLRLVELLAFIQKRFQPRQITLMSGYRSPTFNSALRAGGAKAAQASLHTEGLAADVAFAGLDMRRLWLELRELGTGGAGYYRSGGFLHIDTGKPRFWEETTSRVDENLSAGNARVFARTDFDRYPGLAGAVVNLHSVTAFPLRVSTNARLAGAHSGTRVTLADDEGTAADGDCVTISEYSTAYRLRVTAADLAGPEAGSSSRLVLSTCEPRVEKTPAEIETNDFELAAGN